MSRLESQSFLHFHNSRFVSAVISISRYADNIADSVVRQIYETIGYIYTIYFQRKSKDIRNAWFTSHALEQRFLSFQS